MTVDVVDEGDVRVIYLARPERLNALDRATVSALHEALAKESGALVLAGRGRAFSAGFDLHQGTDADLEAAQLEAMQDLTRALRANPTPSVCALHGHAVGGGLELALACDLVVAAPDASLAFPDVRAGVTVGGGATYLLPRLVGLARSRALLLTGDPISGERAYEIGLVAALARDPIDEARRLATRLARLPREALRTIRRALDSGLDSNLESSLAAELADMQTSLRSSAFAEYRGQAAVSTQLLDEVATYAREYLEGLGERRVGWTASAAELHRSLGGPLPEEPSDPRDVVRELVEAAEPGLAAYGSGRYFGFVMGGATPASRAADWLASTWDQCPTLYSVSPAASVVEDIAGHWATQLLGLPGSVSYGFVTGTQMAHFTALAAARHHLLRQAGWDAEADGLQGAPRLRVIAGAERHVTVDRAVRFLGVGTRNLMAVPADDQGAMRTDDLADALARCDGPTIVCAQAGNINTGSFDPLSEICALAQRSGAWVHVDGAFGLWAAASGRYHHLLAGFEEADSWAVDAHKWLNVPYDCGLVFTAHPEAHRGAMGIDAGYFIRSEKSLERDGVDWNPELSKRARALAVMPPSGSSDGRGSPT